MAVMINGLMEKKIMKAADFQVAKSLDTSCESEQKELFKAECDKYMTTETFKEGTKDTYGQVICCDTLEFCSGPFYTETWFFVLCGGVAFLLIQLTGFVVYLLYCHERVARKIGRGRTKRAEKNTTEGQEQE